MDHKLTMEAFDNLCMQMSGKKFSDQYNVIFKDVPEEARALVIAQVESDVLAAMQTAFEEVKHTMKSVEITPEMVKNATGDTGHKEAPSA